MSAYDITEFLRTAYRPFAYCVPSKSPINTAYQKGGVSPSTLQGKLNSRLFNVSMKMSGAHMVHHEHSDSKSRAIRNGQPFDCKVKRLVLVNPGMFVSGLTTVLYVNVKLENANKRQSSTFVIHEHTCTFV